MDEFDVVVIGGGQSALALGFYLRRTDLSYAILDQQAAAGGAWGRTWPSLQLFSPSRWSSLPGYLMPRSASEYPTRDEVIAYLTEYERRYALPIERPVHVQRVERSDGDDRLIVTGVRDGRDEKWLARTIVSATGSWANPNIPSIPGESAFGGLVLHSANYDGPDAFAHKRVVVVGGGNSGAQIVAELSDAAARVTWATLRRPMFLPDEIDGRYLFEQATARYNAIKEGRPADPPRSLGDIVAVPRIRGARARGALESRDVFVRFTEHGVVWPDGSMSKEDVVIWATGFRAALAHLASLGITNTSGRIDVVGTRAVKESRLWLLGYGEWTGFASATLIGVGRTARATVDEIVKSIAAASSADD
jgi:cation diffusion facilitator CzcD-associated flavoprotein CzcO